MSKVSSKKTTKTPPLFVGKQVILCSDTPNWTIAYGTVVSESDDGRAVVLADARWIAYFDASSKTVAGIAENGVSKAARVSSKMSLYRMSNVSSLFEITNPTAIASIEAAPWG